MSALGQMNVTVGTFNLNNLFSRFNFQADVSTAATSTVESTTKFAFSDPGGFKLREYKGRLVKEKPAEERKLIADRIKRMNLDVLPRRTQRSSKPMCLSKTSRLPQLPVRLRPASAPTAAKERTRLP